jgi:release factor glutamine methyltransferase
MAADALPQPKTAGEMLAMARSFLARHAVEEARLEAELLIGHALGLDRLHLFMQLDRPVAAREIDAARDLLVRRGRREPVAYITGRREFYARGFRVGPGVLIPRPETELLVDRARELAKHRTGLRVVDFGTGSGCIALTLALELAGANVLALEISPAAVLCARANAEALGASIELVEGEGFTQLDRRVASGERFDLVVSNPPYVRADERASLAPEVREHEPALALFAPPGNPDHFVRELSRRARGMLAPGGVLLIELGAGQAVRVLELARTLELRASTLRDLAGIERVLEIAP